jgi:hypothetical protein
MGPEEIRPIVLGVLSRLYVPVPAHDLALLAGVAAGLNVSEDTVANLARRDLEDFSGGMERDPWICPALGYPSGSANYDYSTRSDWPARSRLVAGRPSQAQGLALLRAMCDMAATGEERGDASPALRMLSERIDELAVIIPGPRIAEMRSRRTVPTSDVILYREIAEDLCGPLSRVARNEQREVADAIDRLPPPRKYFGI